MKLFIFFLYTKIKFIFPFIKIIWSSWIIINADFSFRKIETVSFLCKFKETF